jgi:hypothetical protein
MHRQTQKALGRRAIKAAQFLEGAATELLMEMKQQNVPFLADELNPDGDLTIAMPRRIIRYLIWAMREQAAEIRKFSN